MAINISLFLCVLIFLPACDELPNQPTSGPPASEFFWPLQEGNTFTYESSDGETRIIELTVIKKNNHGFIHVEAAGKSDKTDNEPNVTTRFIVNPVDDVIQVHYSQNRTQGQATVLKGPIAIGTTWSTFFTMRGPTGAAKQTINIVAKGDCRIHAVENQEVFGQQRQCMKYTCPQESSGLTVIDEGVYCKRLGRLRSSSTIYYKNGKQKPFTHEERLIGYK